MRSMDEVYGSLVYDGARVPVCVSRAILVLHVGCLLEPYVLLDDDRF